MAAACCMVCDVGLGGDDVVTSADPLQRLTWLLQLVAEPASDHHLQPCSSCQHKMSQVEALLEELRAAYCHTRKAHCSSGWTQEVVEADERRYHMGRLTMVQTETTGTQTEQKRHTEILPPDVPMAQSKVTPDTKVSKGRSLKKLTEPRKIKQEPDIESTTPGNNLTCPVCGDQLKTQGGYRRHLKNHDGATPNTPSVKIEAAGQGEETATPRKRGRTPGTKAVQKKEQYEKSEDRSRAELLVNLQDHIYSELSAPSAGSTVYVDEDNDNYNTADNDDQEEPSISPPRKQRKRGGSEGVVTGPPYECDTCQKVFKVKRDVERHREMVHNSPTERFACDECDMTFKWKQSLKAHQKKHTDGQPSAADANMGDENKEELSKTMSGPPFQCETCQKVFKLKRDLDRHQKMVHSPNLTERFACDKCDMTFKWKQSLKAHQKQHTDTPTLSEDASKENEKKEDLGESQSPRRKYRRRMKSEVIPGPPFVCELCEKPFKLIYDLERHQEMVHNTDPTQRYACDQCGMTFKWRQTFRGHQKLHQDAARFECEVCHKIFKYRQVLERHQNMLHSTDPTRYPCHQCSLTFKWKQSLTAHLRLHNGERPYACSLCPKAFRSSGTLKQHVLSHEGTKLYQCHICNARFTRSMRLQIHLRRHTGELPYVCEQCGTGFADPQIYKRHMLEHEGQKPHVCGDCGKSFTMARYLTEHRKGHTGQREYLCAICGAAFANSGRLRRHMGVHGAKKHKCTMCDKTYKYKEALDNHLNAHMGLKPHLCSHCGRSFSQRSGLRAHALQHTAQPKPFKCDVCDKQFSTAAKVRRHAVLHGEKQVKKEVSRVYDVSVQDAAVDVIQGHDETYDETIVLEISNEAFVPQVAAVEEANDVEEVSAASESLLQVLTQQAASPPSTLSRDQQLGVGEVVEQEPGGDMVQVIEYAQEEETVPADSQTIYVHSSNSNPGSVPSSVGQIIQVMNSAGNLIYQIAQQ